MTDSKSRLAFRGLTELPSQVRLPARGLELVTFSVKMVVEDRELAAAMAETCGLTQAGLVWQALQDYAERLPPETRDKVLAAYEKRLAARSSG